VLAGTCTHVADNSFCTTFVQEVVDALKVPLQVGVGLSPTSELELLYLM
jgi:hypothetical protein